ncbi:MAG: cysteine desulfurase [Clostridia bacterium]|nr:cysteine desulfurase [Clostridia bacterium]
MKVYLDHAATTPLDKRVLKAMTPYLGNVYANPSSSHFFGREALKALDFARDTLAEILNASPSEVYFTSGGSESDNWAIKGSARAVREKTGKTHVLLSAIEHHAALNSAKALKKEGFDVELLPVGQNGILDLSTLEQKLKDDTALVCVMTANNEVGTLQPVTEIAALTHAKGGLLFTDAVQAAGYMDIGKNALNADMVAFSAHKFYGPKGMGALYIKKGTPILPFIDGGEQERGLRGGTSNVAGAVGLATALRLAVEEREKNNTHVRALRNYFLESLFSDVKGVALNGDTLTRLPSNANVAFTGVDGTALLHRLDLRGIAVSAGSACASGSIEPSHVLTAMGLGLERAKSSLRFTFGKDNTKEQVEYTVKALKALVDELRSN